MAKKISKVYVVQVGSFDESPEDVYVHSVHSTFKSALKTRNELYMESVDQSDEDDLEELAFDCVDNGHEFYNIVEKELT